MRAERARRPDQGNYNAAGEWDEREPPFTRAELDRAVVMRQAVTPAPNVRRRDRCPHTPMCPDTLTCVEYIAWYLRHQPRIEARS